MGGRHKPAIEIAGRSVIDRTVSAIWSAVPSCEVVIAGPATGLSAPLRRRVTVVSEEPPFSGPLAGVAAALDAVPPENGVMLLLGGDLPFLSPLTMARLLAAVAAGAPVASCLDSAARLQYLCTGWQEEVMRGQLAQIVDPTDIPLRALFAGRTPELIECDPDELHDIDTPEDLKWANATSHALQDTGECSVDETGQRSNPEHPTDS